MKKVAIIGIVGIPARYGGFERFTEQLVQRLCDQFEITVYCQKSAFQEHPKRIGKVNLQYMPLHANGILSVPFDTLELLHASFRADTILILGVGCCPLLPFVRMFHRKVRFICNMDGLEWRRGKWSWIAKWYLKFAEWCAVKYADYVVGDNQVIVDYIKHTYNKSCELIEYGADNVPMERK